MQLVLPMAGLGQRFIDAGFDTPKPLIPVDGVPMVLRVIADLPPASRVVCVVHPEHVSRFGIDRLLRAAVPGVRVVVAPGLTDGQACSAALAEPELDAAEAVLVAACDNTHLYDRAAFHRLTAASGVEAIIWTYRGEARVGLRPQSIGWVRPDARPPGDRVAAVSCKVPLSNAPLNDHAISGTFWFRTARLLCDGVRELVRSGRRVNNEFYLDVVPNVLIDRGADVRLFEVDKYIGWGTPDDLADYQRWGRYFATQQRRAA